LFLQGVVKSTKDCGYHMFTFLSQKFSGILSWMTNKGRITQENVQEACAQVREALIEADVPLAVVDTFLDEISKELLSDRLQSTVDPGNYFVKIVHDRLLDFLGGPGQRSGQARATQAFTFQIPSVTLVMGLQGSGKTTTLYAALNLVPVFQ
jgi:signal recognition particle subunit SRP54